MNIYKVSGFENRVEYILSLAKDYDVDEGTVFTMANFLGPNEDFDGLLSALEDIAEGYM